MPRQGTAISPLVWSAAFRRTLGLRSVCALEASPGCCGVTQDGTWGASPVLRHRACWTTAVTPQLSVRIVHTRTHTQSWFGAAVSSSPVFRFRCRLLLSSCLRLVSRMNANCRLPSLFQRSFSVRGSRHCLGSSVWDPRAGPFLQVRWIPVDRVSTPALLRFGAGRFFGWRLSYAL